MLDEFPVVVRFPLYWSEMDALGHVNNARFFTWFETARIALFARIGVLSSRPGAAGPILATTTCDFLKPVVYPGDMLVGTRVTKVGNTSLHMEYAVARVDAAELCARGSSVVVLIDFASGSRMPVPDEVRRAIAALG